jgi:hypothetical protein
VALWVYLRVRWRARWVKGFMLLCERGVVLRCDLFAICLVDN